MIGSHQIKKVKKILVLLTIFALAVPALGAVKAKSNPSTANIKTKFITVEAATKIPSKEVSAKKEIKFKDLTTKDPTYSYVMKMVVSYEAISGYPDGTFKGNKTITRAEFSKIMTNSLAYLEKRFNYPLAEEPATPEVKFKDLNAKNWAFPFVAKLVTKYKIISGYPDGTFRPNQTINRYELATVLAKTLKLIYSRYEMTLPSPTREAAIADVKPGHWAMKDIQLLLYSKIMNVTRQKNKVLFAGTKAVTRFEVTVSTAKLINQSETAIASLPKKIREAVAPPSQVEKAAQISSRPEAYFSGGAGNVYESASGTNNWMGFNGSASYGNIFKLWRLSGNYEIAGKYGFNQIVYVVPSGGGVAGGTVNENRYELELNTIYPIVKFLGVTGKLLVGAKYINLNNPTAPTNFTGLNLGVVTAANLFGKNVLARAFYSYPLARASVSPSIFGQPTQLFDYEASIDATLFRLPLLLGFSGETMTLSGGPARYYNNFFVRYFLL